MKWSYFEKIRLRNYLPGYIIRQLYRLVPIIVLSSLFEIISLGLLIPVVRILIAPEMIQSNRFLKIIWEYFNLNDQVLFVLVLLLFVLLTFFIKNVCSFFLVKKQSDTIYKVVSEMIIRKFNSFLNKPFHSHINDDPSKELTAIISIPYFYSAGVIMPITAIFSEGIIISIILFGIAIYNLKILLSLLLFIGPIFYFYSVYYKNRLKNISNLSEKHRTKSDKIVYEAVEGLKEILIFNNKEFYKKNLKSHIEGLKKVSVDYYLITLFSPKVIELVSILALVSIIFFSYFLNYDLLYISNFLVLFAISMYRVIPSMNKILLSVNNIRANAFTIKYIVEEKEIDTPDSKNEIDKPLDFNDEVEIRNLSFSFGDKRDSIIKDISIKIKKGDSIGIMGPSGSGKSTLLNLLLRLLPETEGGIYVDKVKLISDNRISWYKTVGFVPQNIVLFDGTLEQNICWGLPESESNVEQVDRVIKMANLSNVVSGLKDGIKTYIGDNGIKLSGGQRQRLAIARALYHNPKILIFDEATSALDEETEKEITDAIKQLNSVNITIIVVAHRKQTLKNCNRIFELKDGKLNPLS